jgi:hypothetical protein
LDPLSGTPWLKSEAEKDELDLVQQQGPCLRVGTLLGLQIALEETDALRQQCDELEDGDDPQSDASVISL